MLNNNKVKIDEQKITVLNKEHSNVQFRDKSSNHSHRQCCSNNNNHHHPIQTSYEAIQATLKNHELIIELLNKILLKFDKDLIKESNHDKSFKLILQDIKEEIQRIKA